MTLCEALEEAGVKPEGGIQVTQGRRRGGTEVTG